MLNNIGASELTIIAIFLLILFGGRKLPELGRGIGESIKELKSATKSDSSDKKKK